MTLLDWLFVALDVVALMILVVLYADRRARDRVRPIARPAFLPYGTPKYSPEDFDALASDLEACAAALSVIEHLVPMTDHAIRSDGRYIRACREAAAILRGQRRSTLPGRDA